MNTEELQAKNMHIETVDDVTWVVDSRDNRWSVTTYRSIDQAVTNLESCSDCEDCEDCLDCSGCSDCTRCSDCFGCSSCTDCSDCSRCSRCSDCSDCSDCSGEQRELVVPVIEDIHRKVLEAVTNENHTLDMSTWHACETTHCRAGWVVHLAGKAGYDLESKTSALFAAQQIYKASGYEISPCRFFDGNDAAMDDIRRLAK